MRFFPAFIALSFALLLPTVATAQQAVPPRPTAVETYDFRDPPVRVAHVQLEANVRGVELQRKSGDGWDAICVAPCTATLDPSATYRVDGRGLHTSDDFRVGEGEQRVRVSAGSQSYRVAGLVLTPVGGVLLFGSFLAYFAQINFDDEHPRTPNYTPAAALLAAGTATLVTGIVLIAAGRTTVDVERAGAVF